MAASDIDILRDRAHIPTKKSLLELTSQDALLAQNKLLSKQLEALTETDVPSVGELMNLDVKQGPSLYDRTTKLEETLAQFMQVSMSNQKSTESAIKNLEVQVGQLAKQLMDRSLSSFIANTEKNPKEECKAVMTRSRMTIHVDESEAKKKMEEHKQYLAPKPTLEPVSDFFEEINEEAEDDKEEETPIKEKE
ncbi:hypothetical protein HKD37_10G028664 [Glycine soja]